MMPALPGSEDRLASLTVQHVLAALRRVVAERAAGGVEMPPKQSMSFGPGHFFQAMMAASRAEGIAVCKWIGLAPQAGDTARQSHATVLVSELATGRLLDVVAGDAITLQRTAALSLLAFELARKPAPRTIGFVGTGRQALAHLDAFAHAWPSLSRACFHQPRAQARAAFGAACTARGLECEAADDAAEVLSTADVIVTTVPGDSSRLGFLDARLTHADAFITAVDVGRSWDSSSLAGADLQVFTDDLPQTLALLERKAFGLHASFAADLPALACGRAALRPQGRTLFAFSGSAYADLAAVLALRSPAPASAG